MATDTGIFQTRIDEMTPIQLDQVADHMNKMLKSPRTWPEQSLWVPEFGWVMLEGKPTEHAKPFYDKVLSKIK